MKLLAEWFWTDRWTGSSAFMLSIEARGLYREMLTQAWRRGASLPNDYTAIQRVIGATEAEWMRCWPTVAKFWRVEGNTLVNDTQIAIYAEAVSRSDGYREKARKAAEARWKDAPSNTPSIPSSNARAMPSDLRSPISDLPSPDLRSPSLDPGLSKDRGLEKKNGSNGNGHAVTARSKRPIFSGTRFVVFEWQFDDLRRLLGKHFESFGLDTWFHELNLKTEKAGEVVPQRDGGKWLQAHVLAEAERRGLTVAEAPQKPSNKRIAGLIKGGEAFLRMTDKRA